MSVPKPYLLSAQTLHSGNDIKCVVGCKASDASAGCPRLITASRDYSVKAWMVGAESMLRVSSVDSEAPPVEGTVNSIVELQTMAGHTDYLQCVAEDPSGTIICSGSNDKTIRVWSSSTGSNVAVLVGHEAATKSLAFFTAADGRVLLASGGWDHKCCVWDVFGSRRMLLDCYLHTQPVVCLIRFSKSARSAATALAADGSNTGATAPAAASAASSASAAAAAVASFGGDLLLSASGDKRVVLWDPNNYGKALIEFIGHTDTVQALAQIDHERFASAGNDGDILLWDVPVDAASYMSVKTVRIPACRINAHESFVYALAWDPSEQALISAGEDKTIRVWDGVATAARNNGAPPRSRQMILQPCLIWSVSVVDGANGPTFAAAGADGLVRLWTTNADLIAGTETMDAFDAQVAASGGSSGGAGGAAGANPDIPDPSTLPTAEELNQQGPPQRDGQQRFVRGAAGEVELYTGQAGQWVHLGTVIANPNATGGDAGAGAGGASSGAGARAGGRDQPPRKGQYYKGVAYDYLFPISVGQQQLSLPYNAGDSVYDAAQNFILDNGELGVSQGDREEIVQHIVSQLHSADRDLLMGGGARGRSEDAAEGSNAANNNNSGRTVSTNHTVRNDDGAPVSQTGRAVGSGPLLRAVFDETQRSTAMIKQKLAEWCGDQLPDLEAVHAAVDTVAAAVPSGGTSDFAAASRLLSPECNLFGKLREDQYLPYFDILRIVACRFPDVIAPSVLDTCVAGAVGDSKLKPSADGAAAASASSSQAAAAAAADSPARGRERCMALRALCNYVIYASPTAVVAFFERYPRLVIDVRRRFLGPDSTPVTQGAAAAFFTNCAVLFGSKAELADAEAERVPELLSAVGAWLVWERSEEQVGVLLRIAANLMIMAPSEVTRAVAASGSAESIGPEVDRLLAQWPANDTLKALKKALQ